jgi:hypothetical protein
MTKRIPAYLQFLQSTSTTTQTIISEFISDIINTIESTTTHASWRALISLFETLDNACESGLFQSKDLSEKYVSVLIKCFNQGNFEVKRIAASSFITLMKFNKVGP